LGFNDIYEPRYAIFVDEAGDPGIRNVSPLHPNGSSEWFTMAAVVIDQTRDADTVEWVRSIKEAVRQTQRADLHYAKLPIGGRRREACEMLSALPCRAFVVASHKINMSGFENSRAAKRDSQNFFYNWVMRVLLERSTNWIREHSLRTYGEVHKARVVLSAAGGLRYTQTVAYHELLRMQSQGKGPYLNKGNIAWDVISPSLYETVQANRNAGVQLADLAASAFYQAANASARSWDLEPALALRKIIPTKRKSAANCGVTLMPLKPSDRRLGPDQKRIFEAYGYRL